MGNWNLLYENVTPTNDPIAVFKKIDAEKFFLEDPKNLLDPTNYEYYECPTIDFSTATWGKVFEYSIDMRSCLRLYPLISENPTEFMKTLAISAAQNCPLDFKVRGENPLHFAVDTNDVDVASILLQRDAVIEPISLERAIDDLNLEMVKILLKNGADVHAELNWMLRPQSIHEYSAQQLQAFETYHERDENGWYSFDNLERKKKINKLVIERKDNHLIKSEVLNYLSFTEL